jgi:CPA1 family monovalent cation:H+ antiporter
MTDQTTLLVIRLFVVFLAAAAGVALIARRAAIPYSVAFVGFGLVVGALAGVGRIEVTPGLVLIVLLPGLIFEASYQIEIGRLRATGMAVFLLAGPGVLIAAGLVALVLWQRTGLRPEIGFVVGAIVAATDPASVIASFRRLRAPRGLSTLVEAESLFNDGTGVVLFALAVGAVSSPTSPGPAALSFVVTIAVSTTIGIAAGLAATQLIVRVNDHLIELTISVVLAYGTYLVADAAHQSGIIATAVAGLVLGNVGRRLGLSRLTIDALDTVWEFLAFLLTALVFLLVGLAIPAGELVHAIVPIGWAVLAVLLARALIVYLLVGGLARLAGQRRGLAIEPGWLHVVFWSGLRGGVSVALALSLPADFPERALVQEIAFGVVLFTLVTQATTIHVLLARLGLVRVEPEASEAEPRAEIGPVVG